MQNVTKAHLHLFTCHYSHSLLCPQCPLSPKYCDSVKEILDIPGIALRTVTNFPVTIASNGNIHRYEEIKKKGSLGFPPAVQWLVLCASIAGTRGSIPGGGNSRSHMLHGTTKKGDSCFHSFFFLSFCNYSCRNRVIKVFCFVHL